MKEQCQVAVTSFTLNMGVVLYAKQIMYAFQEITKYVCISGDCIHEYVCMHFRSMAERPTYGRPTADLPDLADLHAPDLTELHGRPNRAARPTSGRPLIG
jgi:hypothetical protein